MKKIILLMICMLQVVTTFAYRFTLDGIIYDDGAGNGMSTVHDGRYVYFSVVGVNSDFTGDLIIPALPAKSDVAGFTIYFMVTGIASNAFADNTKITSVTLPSTLTTLGANPFSGCTALTYFEVAEDNSSYSSLDGVLYNKSKTFLLKYPPNKADASFSIPASVTTVTGYSFGSCQHLSSVTFPQSVNNIGSGLFYDCRDLKDITVFWNTPTEVKTNDDSFSVEKNTITLHIPIDTKNAYLASDAWKDFNIVEEAMTGIVDVKAKGNIAVSPSLAIDYITISGLQPNEIFSIYNINGQQLLSRKASSEAENIPVSHLPAGIYFVKTNAGQVLKWVKK